MSLVNRAIPLAMGLCVAMIPITRHADAAEAEKPATEVVRASQRPTGEQQIPTNKEELSAVDVARAALARALYVPPDTLPVLSIEKRTWPDSGLGCASPDTATIRISRRGYAVALATPDGVRNVHVSGRSSRVCNLPTKASTEEAVTPEAIDTPPPSYDLKAVVERSREDLARRLKAPIASVRLVSFAATTWPDNTMGCAVPYEQTRKKTVKGYRIQLRQGDRTYMYHTDLVRTRACPSVETPPATASAPNYELPAKSTERGTSATKTKNTKNANAAAAANFFGVVPRYPSP